jgi:hypothetical protein
MQTRTGWPARLREKSQNSADPIVPTAPLVSMSAFYVKNVSPTERAIRIILSVIALVVAFVVLNGVWRPVVAAGAGAFALTGLVGFCPACAMIGRTLGPR